MVYLSTEAGRWGFIRRRLPEPHRSMFNEFINTLHVKHLYNGGYPKDRVEEEFNGWSTKVWEYIQRLKSEVQRR